MLRRVVPAMVLLALAAGCGPSANGGDGGILEDSGPGDPPPRPTLEMPPSPVPYTVTTLRGTSPDAQRIIVTGADNPPSTRVLTTSEFCVDVPMPTPGVYELTVRSQNESGVLSSPSEPVMVEFDPEAPTDPTISTCSGAPAGGCPSDTEICGNDTDDNCNGLVDGDDPDCFDCDDDPFEPNDDIMSPRVDAKRHDDLMLCSMDQDFYGVFADAGQTLDVNLYFSHAEGDLDLELYDTEGSVMESSVSITDDEQISGVFIGTAGEYQVRVYSPDSAEVGYSLDISLSSG